MSTPLFDTSVFDDALFGGAAELFDDAVMGAAVWFTMQLSHAPAQKQAMQTAE